MGCIQSFPEADGGKNSSRAQGEAVFVFVPPIRAPCRTTEVGKVLNGLVPTDLADHLSALRNRIEVMASEENRDRRTKTKQNTAAHHSGSNIADLQLALEDYLPVLLGLNNEGSKLREAVEFPWINEEDPQQETSIASTLYELLSVLHLLAILGLSQANFLLTPKPPADGYQPKVTQEDKKAAIHAFLKASGILKCAMGSVIPQMSEDLMKKLPADLREGTLNALSMQALGQGTEIQLSFAVDNAKASLAVKRRLACELVKCWKQVHESVVSVRVGNTWEERHNLFINWKLAEAKAAAYYFHGLILNEVHDDNTRAKAMICLQLADTFLLDSQKFCTEFCATTPKTRIPPLWGAMKYLSEKIPKDATARGHKSDAYHQEEAPQKIPELPDFSVALQPAAYDLPPVDAAWSVGHSKSTATLNA